MLLVKAIHPPKWFEIYRPYFNLPQVGNYPVYILGVFCQDFALAAGTYGKLLSYALHATLNDICGVIALELLQRLEEGPFDIWQEIICYWERLTALIKHIESLQTPLSSKLAVARANEFAAWGRTQTPTLLDTGRLIFRSQVPSLPSGLDHLLSQVLKDCYALKLLHIL